MLINIDSTSQGRGLSLSCPFCLILPEENRLNRCFAGQSLAKTGFRWGVIIDLIRLRCWMIAVRGSIAASDKMGRSTLGKPPSKTQVDLSAETD